MWHTVHELSTMKAYSINTVYILDIGLHKIEHAKQSIWFVLSALHRIGNTYIIHTVATQDTLFCVSQFSMSVHFKLKQWYSSCHKISTSVTSTFKLVVCVWFKFTCAMFCCFHSNTKPCLDPSIVLGYDIVILLSQSASSQTSIFSDNMICQLLAEFFHSLPVTYNYNEFVSCAKEFYLKLQFTTYSISSIMHFCLHPQ